LISLYQKNEEKAACGTAPMHGRIISKPVNEKKIAGKWD
jgi:hypothetical protein